uniref:PD-(D/E)XK nuclease family protein n=1 Tax=Pedobacter aquatilis TaxID=351343 RepID=UPI00292DB965
MSTDTLNFENLIREFSKLPKIISDPTYLELCRYPSNRFEDICSRLLCFYFDPTGEHGFTNLFLDALLEVISKDGEIFYRNNEVQVINEVNSEQKRLDILIKCPDMIIGIENKIYASVYNPLETYAKQIALFGKKNIFKIILTVRKITDQNEKTYIANNGFQIVNYTDYFTVIKRNIGNYITNGNPKYLTFIYDFIQTIENMTGENYNNNKLIQFFSNNSEEIENLITQYQHYNERTLKIQKDAIAELMLKISTITGENWWAW